MLLKSPRDTGVRGKGLAGDSPVGICTGTWRGGGGCGLERRCPEAARKGFLRSRGQHFTAPPGDTSLQRRQRRLPGRGRGAAIQGATGVRRGRVSSAEAAESRGRRVTCAWRAREQDRSCRSLTGPVGPQLDFSVSGVAEGSANSCPSSPDADDDLHTLRPASGSAVTPSQFQPPIHFQMRFDQTSPVPVTGHRGGGWIRPVPPRSSQSGWGAKDKTQRRGALRRWLSSPATRSSRRGAALCVVASGQKRT